MSIEQYTLSSLEDEMQLELSQHARRCNILIRRVSPNHIIKHIKGVRGRHGQKSEIYFTETGYNLAKFILSSFRSEKQSKGYVYAFLLAYHIDGSPILKVG